MEEPYRFLKKLRNMGNSVGILIPKVWFAFEENKKIKEVIVEVFSDKIVVRPHRKKR